MLRVLFVVDLNDVVLRRQYPCIIVYLWLTNTTRMAHVDADVYSNTSEHLFIWYADGYTLLVCKLMRSLRVFFCR